MPLYICNTAPGALDADAKTRIAQVITDTHCAVTGAPSEFVHALFFEAAPEFPLDDKTVFVRGTIRKGRSDEQIDRIARQLCGELAQIAGVAVDRVAANILETPASWVMEGGEIMPEPGEEDAWLERAHRAKARAH